jgi:hypothetical protein
MLQNKTLKAIFTTAFGLLLFLWMSYSLYHQVKQQPNLNEVWHSIILSLSKQGKWSLAVIILLMMLNWSIEALKWRALLRDIEPISFSLALQSVLTGLSISILTPNRIGEYMGRILYLRNKHKMKALPVQIVGSFALLIVSGFFGLGGLIFYILQIRWNLWILMLSVASVGIVLGITFIYFHLKGFVNWFTRFRLLKKGIKYARSITRLQRSQLIRILLLSGFRYMVYSIQFALLLKLCLVDISWGYLFPVIFLFFWTLAIIPTIAIAELGIRGGMALYFFLPLSNNSFGILAATCLLWFINLILPSIVGTLFVFRVKWDDV